MRPVLAAFPAILLLGSSCDEPGSCTLIACSDSVTLHLDLNGQFADRGFDVEMDIGSTVLEARCFKTHCKAANGLLFYPRRSKGGFALGLPSSVQPPPSFTLTLLTDGEPVFSKSYDVGPVDASEVNGEDCGVCYSTQEVLLDVLPPDVEGDEHEGN